MSEQVGNAIEQRRKSRIELPRGIFPFSWVQQEMSASDVLLSEANLKLLKIRTEQGTHQQELHFLDATITINNSMTGGKLDKPYNHRGASLAIGDPSSPEYFSLENAAVRIHIDGKNSFVDVIFPTDPILDHDRGTRVIRLSSIRPPQELTQADFDENAVNASGKLHIRHQIRFSQSRPLMVDARQGSF